MIYQYELLTPPKGKVLFNLERLARDNRFDEYAQTFREAIRDEFGVELPGVAPSPTELLFASVTGIPVSGSKTPEQKMMHDALQTLMEQTDWPGPGYEAVHAIRKGQARWVGVGQIVRQLRFIAELFQIAI
jgi:hypothetical protein